MPSASPEPRWLVIRNDLTERMLAGEFDERFPTDRELVEHYDVSRHTIREAVRKLTDEGLIIRRPGRGSYRAPSSFSQTTGAIYSLFRSVEQSGVSQTSVVIALEPVHDEAAAKILELSADAPLFHLERIRLADGIPLAHDRVWLPLAIAEPLLDADFGRTALYDELRRHCDIIPEEGVEVARPITLDRTVATMLGRHAGDAAFEIDRRTMARGRPLEWRITIARGDRFAIQSEWERPWDHSSTEFVHTDS